MCTMYTCISHIFYTCSTWEGYTYVLHVVIHVYYSILHMYYMCMNYMYNTPNITTDVLHVCHMAHLVV